MDVTAMERFTALLALLAGAGAIVLAAGRLAAVVVAPVRRLIHAVSSLAGWLAWLVAASATAGSLYFSEVANFAPCRLCWFQRVFMYPMAVVLLVAAIRRDRSVRWYALPLCVIGAAVSLYHYLIEWNPQWEGSACDVSVPCSVPWFREFGFVSLSFMALCGFLAIAALLTIPRTQED